MMPSIPQAMVHMKTMSTTRNRSRHVTLIIFGFLFRRGLRALCWLRLWLWPERDRVFAGYVFGDVFGKEG